MTLEELLQEVEKLDEVSGLGKGLGSAGQKIAKSAGMPGADVSNKTTKALPPSGNGGDKATPNLSGGAGAAGMPPEGQEPIDTTPETVEALPEAEPMEFDRLGSPDKHHLKGHTVKWGGQDHVLDWDDEYEVYKVVNPVTLRVKTRVRPDSISTMDYKPESVTETIYMAIDGHVRGVPVDSLINMLLDG
ncbi:MAG: hypothetical protein ACXABY_14740 [Candidatus Thorarchaeota archaeon]|jgi:hypothetical protein